jgi:hypothetical protein
VLINDLYTNGGEHSSVDHLNSADDFLHAARNFLFLTVPPTERTPTLRSLSTINITDYTSTLALCVLSWNSSTIAELVRLTVSPPAVSTRRSVPSPQRFRSPILPHT